MSIINSDWLKHACSVLPPILGNCMEVTYPAKCKGPLAWLVSRIIWVVYWLLYSGPGEGIGIGMILVLNTPQKVRFPHPNRDYNFQIICYIINSITLLCGEFNNAHLDTLFASIDPKIMKLHPISGTYTLESENRTKSHWSQTCLPCMVMIVDICLDMFMFLLLFTTRRDQDVKN